MYCKDACCRKIICSKCYISDHKLHDVADIDDEVKEKVNVIKDAETAIEHGKTKLCRAQDIMIKMLTTTLEDIENKREELKVRVDEQLNSYARECVEQHEQNMRIIEAKKDFLDGRLKVLKDMKNPVSVLAMDEKVFQLEKVDQMKESADFFSQTDGFTGLSYNPHHDCALSEKWKFVQFCGELMNFKWNFDSENAETDGQITQETGRIALA